jgi:hypothetical protein
MVADETFDIGVDTHAGERQGLPGAVSLQWQDRQGDLQARTMATDRGRPRVSRNSWAILTFD